MADKNKYRVTPEDTGPVVKVKPQKGVPLLRTSERNDFKRCPWLWQETWLKGYGTRRVPTWAWFGTAVHAGLEARYKIGTKRGKVGDMIEAFDASIASETARIWTENPNAILDQEEVAEAGTLGRAMLMGYVEEYGNDTEWEVIHTEQPFQINVPNPAGGPPLVIYAGTWDLLCRNRITKEFWLWDHKTRKSFPKNWEFYDINDQGGSYLWVAPEVLKHLGVFGKKDRIEGLVFNALKKSMPDNRPRNADGLATNKPQKVHYEYALSEAGIDTPARTTIAAMHLLAEQAGLTVLGEPSAVQPAVRYHRAEVYRTPRERVQQGQRVQQEATWMAAIREGKLEAFKTPTEDCMRCKIVEYCMVHEADPAEGLEMRNAIMMPRDYYADHHRDMTLKGGVDLGATEPKGKRKHGSK